MDTKQLIQTHLHCTTTDGMTQCTALPQACLSFKNGSRQDLAIIWDGCHWMEYAGQIHRNSLYPTVHPLTTDCRRYVDPAEQSCSKTGDNARAGAVACW